MDCGRADGQVGGQRDMRMRSGWWVTGALKTQNSVQNTNLQTVINQIPHVTGKTLVISTHLFEDMSPHLFTQNESPMPAPDKQVDPIQPLSEIPTTKVGLQH